MSVLTAEGLTVSATMGEKSVEALRNIDMALAKGQVLGLVGESGAGKSMIGRVIAHNLPSTFSVTRGSLRFGDQDLLSATGAQRLRLLGDRIAFIPQEPLTALNPVLTIAQQFGEHLARLGVAFGERRSRIIAMLREVRLRDPDALLDQYPFQLSGGMCQRVLIAMAFASRPALIIADEPTTALDVSTQVHIVQIIRGMQRDYGTAMLFITHDLRLASHVCDDIMVLYAGDVVERGPGREITDRPRHPYTRALIAANPPLTGPVQRLRALPDQMPGLAGFADLPGCRFAPRCPTRDPLCASAVPDMQAIGDRRWVRCAPGCLSDVAIVDDTLTSAPPPLPSSTPILKLENVSKHYPAARKILRKSPAGVHAVRPVDLEIRPGEFVGVVGESGSGKSTLARMVMGLTAPSNGRILIEGEDVTSDNASAHALRIDALQIVFQDPQSALNPRRTVFNLVTQPMEAATRASARSERNERARALATETGLASELLNRYPSQLSGGQKQRVNIARALCVTPRLLVADEIVSGLDVSVQAQILNLLLDIREKRGIGLLFISHDLAVVRYLCSRVLVMQNGFVVEHGPTGEVFERPQHPYTQSLLAAVPPDDAGRTWPPESAASVTAA
ncbi:ABC transporter ATP-binding protein [Terrarubrum flagellatum]|uniref:ABC transporter ATP-binding protein n=1 Tax=Terrirubrum flagellatum TaxID=2895980 RepID=UPI003144E1D5